MMRQLSLLIFVLLLFPAISLSEQQGKVADTSSCQDWLQIEKMHAYRLDEYRDKLEQEKASMEYALYQEQQKRKQLEKELEAFRQAHPEKANP